MTRIRAGPPKAPLFPEGQQPPPPFGVEGFSMDSVIVTDRSQALMGSSLVSWRRGRVYRPLCQNVKAFTGSAPVSVPVFMLVKAILDIREEWRCHKIKELHATHPLRRHGSGPSVLG